VRATHICSGRGDETLWELDSIRDFAGNIPVGHKGLVTIVLPKGGCPQFIGGTSSALFPQLYYPRSKASAVKLHLLLSLQGNLPAWAAVTEATFPDQKLLDSVPVAPGAFYVMDRLYLDFTRLIRWERAGAFFVVRNKCHVRFRVVESKPVKKETGLRCDQLVRLAVPRSQKVYPALLRRIRFYEATQQRSLVFLTNNFELEADVICELYKRRWQVELFFKWVKQHLKIRGFFGRSENAIRTQIWTAISAYLFVAIAKRQHQLPQSLYEILQVLSVSAFEQLPLAELLAKKTISENQMEFQNLLPIN
jgi:IS4 transposase